MAIVPRSVDIGRHRGGKLGRGGSIQLPAREPVLDPAVVEQRREEQRLVDRVAGAGRQGARRAAQDARVWLVADLVGHVPKDAVDVVVEVVRERSDRVRLRGRWRQPSGRPCRRARRRGAGYR